MARTKVRFTSVQALSDYAETGARLGDRHRILLHLNNNQHRTHTRRSVSVELKLPVNIVSGRVNDLIEDGIVSEGAEPVSCPVSRRTVHSIQVRPEYRGAQF